MAMTAFLGAGYSSWEQTPLIQSLDNSRAIIQECLRGFGRL